MDVGETLIVVTGAHRLGLAQGMDRLWFVNPKQNNRRLMQRGPTVTSTPKQLNQPQRCSWPRRWRRHSRSLCRFHRRSRRRRYRRRNDGHDVRRKDGDEQTVLNGRGRDDRVLGYREYGTRLILFLRGVRL